MITWQVSLSSPLHPSPGNSDLHRGALTCQPLTKNLTDPFSYYEDSDSCIFTIYFYLFISLFYLSSLCILLCPAGHQQEGRPMWAWSCLRFLRVFPCHCCLLGVSSWVSVKPWETILIAAQHYLKINWIELNLARELPLSTKLVAPGET